MQGIYLLDPKPYEQIYGAPERERIAGLVEIAAPPQTRASLDERPGVLREIQVIFSGWGCPTLTRELLDAAPQLRAVFYGAGSVRSIVTDALWERGIQITSAYAVNAVPVVEYTLAQILFALKSGWQHVERVRRERRFARLPVAGAYGTTVGLIALGAIGRLVAERLRGFDLRVIAHDPFVSAEQAAALGVELVSLDELFRSAAVVSLHAPWLKETEGMVTGAHLAAMPPYATFINTSRGALVREAELVAALRERPDLCAVLDVTYPEPPPPESPLYDMPNVVLTPHIAGSLEGECRRMGQLMVSELERFVRGEPLRYALTRAQVERMT